MKNTIAAKVFAAAVLGFALQSAPSLRAESSAVKFDRGVDTSTALEIARGSAAKDNKQVLSVKAGARGLSRFDPPTCVDFKFGPNDGLQSKEVKLENIEWVEQCTWGDPSRGEGRRCWDEPFTHFGTAQVKLSERRPLGAGESDNFRVCMSGPFFDVAQLESAYQYKVVEGGNKNGRFVLAPVGKLSIKP